MWWVISGYAAVMTLVIGGTLTLGMRRQRGRIRDVPTIRLAHLGEHLALAGGSGLLRYQLHPITARRPARGSIRTSIVCATCQHEVRVVLFAARAARTRQWLWLGLAGFATLLLTADVVLMALNLELYNGTIDPPVMIPSGFVLFLAVVLLLDRWWVEDGVRLPERPWYWDSRRPGAHSVRFAKHR
jgi:hypothetical protein